jgi:hypothetical protein
MISFGFLTRRSLQAGSGSRADHAALRARDETDGFKDVAVVAR